MSYLSYEVCYFHNALCSPRNQTVNKSVLLCNFCKLDGEFSSVITRLLRSLKSLHNSVQLRQAQPFFHVQKVLHVWCFENILIKNHYIFGSVKGVIVSYVPQTLTTSTLFPWKWPKKAIINAQRLQLFFKIQIANTR